jgi:CheY-like chemotaxis protein
LSGAVSTVSRKYVMRVLVIDDKWLVRAVSRVVLESAGYEVLEAGDGVQGLAVLGQRGLDASCATP